MRIYGPLIGLSWFEDILQVRFLDSVVTWDIVLHALLNSSKSVCESLRILLLNHLEHVIHQFVSLLGVEIGL